MSDDHNSYAREGDTEHSVDFSKLSISNDLNNASLESENLIKSSVNKDVDCLLQSNLAQSGSYRNQQVITPWDVKGEVIDGEAVGIDYDKLMRQFGCQPLSLELIERFERQTGQRAHVLLRRGIFYCHRDLEKILDLHAAGKEFYIYTGRGASAGSMHLGHMLPFLFCKYLQDVFQCQVVIQMTDDEKFLFKDGLTLEMCVAYAKENARDIIAVGFNPEKTFIFPDTMYFGQMYPVILKVQKLINVNQANSIFGFDETSSIGRVVFPATQIAPCFSDAFPHLFGGKSNVPCLIPYAIDQDPYFRLCRDIAPRIKRDKPASICSVFFPALQGFNSKMSSSDPNSSISMSDTPAQITKKIKTHAFSGGGASLELHREHGANLAVDIPFQYLRIFLEDDEKLAMVGREYAAGRMLTGDVKKLCTEVLIGFVTEFQARRKLVTDDTVRHFMSFTTVPHLYS